MGNINPFLLLVQIIVLCLAFLMVIFGFYPGLMGGMPQEIQVQSPEGLTMPQEGYVTPLYDGMTRVTVTVDAEAEVEVLMVSASYRGGKLVKDAYNETVLRDTWLVTGEVGERRGTEVVLSEYSAVSNQYIVKVMEPGSSVASSSSYTITIEASTRNPDLMVVGIVLMGMFVILRMYGRTVPTAGKGEGRDDPPPYADGPTPAHLVPPPMVPRPPPQPPFAPPPPPL